MTGAAEVDRQRRKSQADRVLEDLRAAGDSGRLNTDLWRFCHALNSRAADLRDRGFRIETRRVAPGVFRYFLREPSAARPPEATPQRPAATAHGSGFETRTAPGHGPRAGDSELLPFPTATPAEVGE
jgi:hypothetical protein